jgi:hypothetical protein
MESVVVKEEWWTTGARRPPTAGKVQILCGTPCRADPADDSFRARH